jgi:hypothetical protein
MNKILKMSDRIKMKIGDVTFTLAPFSYEHKMEMSDCTKIVAGEEVIDVFKTKTLMLRYGLKGIDGVGDYKLSFTEEGYLTDDCISEVLYLEQSTKMLQACYEIHNGIPEDNKLLTQGVALEVVPSLPDDS